MLEGVPQLEENFSFIDKLTNITSENIQTFEFTKMK